MVPVFSSDLGLETILAAVGHAIARLDMVTQHNAVVACFVLGPTEMRYLG